MNSSPSYSPFIEHSFRRLSLLIREQDALHPMGRSFSKKSSAFTDYHQKNDFSSVKSPNRCPTSNHLTSELNQSLESNRSTGIKHRTYMRPPKTRTMSYRSSPNTINGRSESSLNSCYSPCVNRDESKTLSIHLPRERNPYEIKFENDRQRDLNEKYNIPPPFERQWLRQPRYVPQERPNYGQNQHQ